MKRFVRNGLTHGLPLLALLAPALRHLEAQTDQTSTAIPAPLVVKDDYTGKAIPNAIVRGQIVANVAPDNLQLLGKFDRDGKLVLSLIPDNKYAAEISAPGYKSSRVLIGAAISIPLTTETFNLQPVQKPQVMTQADTQREHGYDIIYGYVLDSVHSAGIGNAEVHLKMSDFTTITDADGFFNLKIPVSTRPNIEPTSEDDLDLDTILITAPGYKSFIKENVELVGDDDRLFHVSLEKGTGSIKETLTPPLVGTGTGVDPEGEAEPDETTEPYSPSLENWLDKRETETPSLHVQTQQRQITLSRLRR